jgi:drug/metabolite transporter (DMT)-like permease
MAQRLFGFSGASTVTGDRAVDLANARALGNALLAFCCVSWAFCFIMYSGEWGREGQVQLCIRI